MHILLIHQSFASLDEPGGTRHHELARFLAARGHKVTIVASPVSYLTGSTSPERRTKAFAGKDIRAMDIESRIEILRAYTYPAFHRSFLHRVISFISFMISSFLTGLRVRQVDLVWGTSPPIFQGLTAWAISRIKRVPLLFEVRDLWPDFAIGMGVLRNPLLIRMSKWLERFLYRSAERVMVNSPGFQEHVRQRGARRVELMPNGADPRMFNPEAEGASFRKAYNLEGKYVALYAGAHGVSNDLGVLLEAASILRDLPQAVIVFLGDGKEKASLVEQAQHMGLENVRFLPAVAKNEMSHALAAADACIAILKPIPLYATVYPNKVFDYMAAGRPVILAIDGVIRQVVEDAHAGIYVQPGDPACLAEAIRELVENPIHGRAMGRLGRRYVEEHFDRALLAERLAMIMEEMGK
jgi:glycosyltransferase involved in cell wall biosynthesis